MEFTQEQIASCPNLVKAVVGVMKAVRNVEKGMTVGEGTGSSYKGVSAPDVIIECRKAMIDNGLMMIPIGIKEEATLERWVEESTYNGKAQIKNRQQVFTKVLVQYALMHESGESIIVVGYGHGVDSQDKGAGKALTYARKNTLIAQYHIIIGDMDDTDNHHSDSYPVPPPAKKQATPPPAPTPKTPTELIKEQLDKFGKVEAAKVYVEYLNAALAQGTELHPELYKAILVVGKMPQNAKATIYEGLTAILKKSYSNDEILKQVTELLNIYSQQFNVQ